MPAGTPLTIKCPKCKRGMFGYPRRDRGCRPTGRVDDKIRRSQHCGHGNGGAGFYGYRGEVECLDCGHKWFSTHPNSGRRRVRPTPCRRS
jgi:ribosomal protein S27E